MNNLKKITFVLALSLSIITASIAQNPQYEAGQNAMHNENYFLAANKFEQASVDENYRQAAWYWQAYSLFKIKHNNQAKGILKELLRLYPQGNWAESAQVLLFEHSKDKERNQDFKLNDELRLVAIEQLFFNNPDKGLPLVTDLLKKSQDIETKKNALHLLGISNAQKASTSLYNFILTEKNKDLKNDAVQMLSLRNSSKSAELLQKLYSKSADKKIKSSIIQGYVHSQDPNQLLKLFKQEKDPDLHKKMINLLGVMGASKQLSKLQTQTKDFGMQKSLIKALAISGDSQAIKDIAAHSNDKLIKAEAIKSFVMLDEIDEEYLLDLYKRMEDKQLKKTLISAFISNDIQPQVILKLLKTETNQAIKKQLLDVMGITNGNDELYHYYQLETDAEIKSQIINMLGINGQYKKLSQLYQQSEDFNNKKDILHAFAISGNKDSADFLLKTYKTADTEIKKIIIQSLFIQDNPAALLEILKTENDYELKKQIIRNISLTDSDAILDQLLQEQ